MPANDFLNYNPQAAFGAQLKTLGQPMRDYFSDKYSDYYRRYLAQLADNPTIAFPDFLKGINWPQEFYSVTPYQRGSAPNRIAPAARFLNY